MKTLLILLSLILSLTAFGSIAEGDLDKLLKEHGTSLQDFRSRGARVIEGEVTGGGKLVPYSKVEVIFTRDEAILKKDIEAITLKDGKTIGSMDSLRSSGKYITSEDVVAIIVR